MEYPVPKISKIYPRDIIAILSLLACFILIFLGINHVVSGIAIMIITYYFSKRVYEEKNPNGDLTGRMDKLEKDRTIVAKFKDVPKPINNQLENLNEPLTTGDFKPAIIPSNIPNK